MDRKLKVLTIFGSPHNKNSNTRAFITDFLDDVESEGLKLDRSFISLGTTTVKPCLGCWNCTREKPCPLKEDDLQEIKAAMLDCDMLIMASPVYTNQVSAQTKALFDRLFTWCHIFPLLGKYSLSACTTGNDGYRETGDFIEKMLATYGTISFGTIVGTGSYTPGFFPRRSGERMKHTSLAAKVARTVLADKKPAPTKWNRRMFTVMKRKMAGVHGVNFVCNGPVKGQPDPSGIIVRLIKVAIKKKNIPFEQVKKLSALMSFEFRWWQDRGWLKAKSFRQLAAAEIPDGFDIKERLL